MEQFKGKYVLREQFGGKGYFAAVSLTAILSDKEKSELVIDISDTVDSEWREAASVGVRIGWQCLPTNLKHGKQTILTIDSVDWQPGDTSEIVVIHVAAKALLSLFEANPQKAPAFASEFGLFLFGK